MNFKKFACLLVLLLYAAFFLFDLFGSVATFYKASYAAKAFVAFVLLAACGASLLDAYEAYQERKKLPQITSALIVCIMVACIVSTFLDLSSQIINNHRANALQDEKQLGDALKL